MATVLHGKPDSCTLGKGKGGQDVRSRVDFDVVWRYATLVTGDIGVGNGVVGVRIIEETLVRSI